MYSAHKSHWSAAIVATAIGMLGLAAGAQAQQEGLPVGWGYTVDDEHLTFTFEAFDVMEDVVVEIEGGRRDARERVGDVRLGETWDVTMERPERTTSFEVRVEGVHAEEARYVEDTMQIEFWEQFDFAYDQDTYNNDSTSQRLVMTMNQPAGQVTIQVRGDDGSLLGERTQRFNGEAPGTPLTVTWTRGAGTVLAIDVRAESTTGDWSSARLIPWAVEQVYDDLHFATGSAEIAAGDEGPLAGYAHDFQAQGERVQEWAEVRLYVAGYTDTVGSDSDNRQLSEDRARSIAQFMRHAGFRYPIYYQGFGEDVLAVQTADNVDEPANRRAIFLMNGNGQHPNGDAFPHTRWHELD